LQAQIAAKEIEMESIWLSKRALQATVQQRRKNATKIFSSHGFPLKSKVWKEFLSSEDTDTARPRASALSWDVDMDANDWERSSVVQQDSSDVEFETAQRLF
jgi:hypothetical protein